MIEKALLPVRLLDPQVQQSFAEYGSQRLNPIGQGNRIHGESSKQMHVIRHYHVTTDSDTALLCFAAENPEDFMHFRSRQKVLTFVCVERDEVKRSDSVKQATEPRRPTRPSFFVGWHMEAVQKRTSKINLI
jgi:hypothetical protein